MLKFEVTMKYRSVRGLTVHTRIMEAPSKAELMPMVAAEADLFHAELSVRRCVGR